jgi:hypothetical protein
MAVGEVVAGPESKPPPSSPPLPLPELEEPAPLLPPELPVLEPELPPLELPVEPPLPLLAPPPACTQYPPHAAPTFAPEQGTAQVQAGGPPESARHELPPVHDCVNPLSEYGTQVSPPGQSELEKQTTGPAAMPPSDPSPPLPPPHVGAMFASPRTAIEAKASTRNVPRGDPFARPARRGVPEVRSPHLMRVLLPPSKTSGNRQNQRIRETQTNDYRGNVNVMAACPGATPRDHVPVTGKSWPVPV